MPLLLRRALPAALGQNPQNMVGVGWLSNAELGLPVTLALGGVFVSTEILASGFDNFMIVPTVTAGGGVTTSYSYDVLDPLTLALLATRTISAGIAGPGTSVLTFGASSQTAPIATRGDVWILFRLRISATAGAANQTIDTHLWAGVR